VINMWRGRVEFGTGIGVHESEFTHWNLAFCERQAMASEALEVITTHLISTRYARSSRKRSRVEQYCSAKKGYSPRGWPTCTRRI